MSFEGLGAFMLVLAVDGKFLYLLLSEEDGKHWIVYGPHC